MRLTLFTSLFTEKKNHFRKDSLFLKSFPLPTVIRTVIQKWWKHLSIYSSIILNNYIFSYFILLFMNRICRTNKFASMELLSQSSGTIFSRSSATALNRDQYHEFSISFRYYGLVHDQLIPDERWRQAAPNAPRMRWHCFAFDFSSSWLAWPPSTTVITQVSATVSYQHLRAAIFSWFDFQVLSGPSFTLPGAMESWHLVACKTAG